jgi:hypothetical protein
MKIRLENPNPLTADSAMNARIDQLGFVNELVKRFSDPLKDQIKWEMTQAAADRAAGLRFEALLVRGTSSLVDPAKFLQLYERGKLSRAQFVSAIRVQRDAALDALSRDALDAISTATPSSPALRVTRIKGVEIVLIDAVRAIADAIHAAPAPAPAGETVHEHTPQFAPATVDAAPTRIRGFA